VATGEVEGYESILLGGVEIGCILQPDIAASGEFGMVLPFDAADFVDSVIDEADDVKLVKGDGSVGQLLGNAFDEGRRHIDADFGNGFGIALMGLEILSECSDRGGILARSDE